MKKDIRDYTDEELSLIVFNDETLYQLCCDYKGYEKIKELFIYTDAQWKCFIDNLNEMEIAGNEDKYLTGDAYKWGKNE